MHLRIIFTIWLCWIASGEIAGQSIPKVSGWWHGYTTQEGDNAFVSKYSFKIYLYQHEGKIWGSSYASTGELFAEMDISGYWNDDNELILTENKVIETAVEEGMEWCLKTLQLKWQKDGTEEILSGNWTGKTSFQSCTPGTVMLVFREAKP